MTTCARCQRVITPEGNSGYWADENWSVLCDPRLYSVEPHTPYESHVPIAEVGFSQAYVVTLPGMESRRFSTRLRALLYLLRITS